ncbi:ATP-binding cassette domain-containing protein [Pseudonocardia nigra]|uniref:ATP-binding cassette domain-containing protein n=1 Tax=Pseudonocardia nigra TaxID=1921578 RepID=UPI002484974F|nr:ATP-binding cassette domain-containing protein [Pseudonocardia nigra]
MHVENLSVDFATDHGWANVVRDVSFTVAEREIVGLVGESGSGKTVTGLSVLGLVPSPPGRRSGGSIRFQGRDLTALPERAMRDIRGNEISMIFQEPMTSLNPAFTVGDQIGETVRRHRGGGRRGAPPPARPGGAPAGRPPPAPSRCSTWSGSPTPPAGCTPTPTSSPAACGSAR